LPATDSVGLEWIMGLSESLPVLFVQIYVLAYLAHVAVYIVGGLALVGLNSYFPERRIQDRDPRFGAWEEIRVGLVALHGSAFCITAGVFVQLAGWASVPVELNFLSFVGFFVLSVFLHDAWFYLEHRMMHTRLLSRWHRLHHTSRTPTVWTNDKFTVLDVLLIQAYLVVIPFLIPIPTAVLVAHRLYDQIKGMIGHGGFEYFDGPWARWPWPFVATIHHDAHHEKYNVNFGNQLTVWDRAFGTLDPEYDARVEAFTLRLKRLKSGG
jgi:sterol desaturase/sphingolipid hydroxylase (fatty acid hydroxylase superfamily)